MKLEFGIVLLKQRQKAGLTKQQVAEAVGVSSSTYHEWECGTTMYRVDVLPKLAQALRIPITDLLPVGLQVTVSHPTVSTTEIAFDARHLYETLIGSLQEQLTLRESQLAQIQAENEQLRQKFVSYSTHSTKPLRYPPSG